MDNLKNKEFIRSIDNRREYMEYDVPQVSTDGEPHEILTMIAVTSGCIVAIIVLFILIVLIDCNIKGNYKNKKKRRPIIFTIFGRNRKSVDFTTTTTSTTTNTFPTEMNISKNQYTTENEMKSNLPEIISINKLTGISTVAC